MESEEEDEAVDVEDEEEEEGEEGGVEGEGEGEDEGEGEEVDVEDSTARDDLGKKEDKTKEEEVEKGGNSMKYVGIFNWESAKEGAHVFTSMTRAMETNAIILPPLPPIPKVLDPRCLLHHLMDLPGVPLFNNSKEEVCPLDFTLPSTLHKCNPLDYIPLWV